MVNYLGPYHYATTQNRKPQRPATQGSPAESLTTLSAHKPKSMTQ